MKMRIFKKEYKQNWTRWRIKRIHITMKKIEILIICCLIVSLLGACGSKETPIQVTGQNGAVYNSYQEACTAQDFVAAHMFLDRMKAEASMMPGKTRREREKKYETEEKIEEAVEYITNKEILLLMSLDDETAFNRITFLIKEDDLSDFKNDEFCDMVIDLALDMDKPELVKRMTNFYKRNISDRILRKIVEKLYIYKGDENIDFISVLLNRNDKNEILLNAAIEKGDEKLVVDMAQSQSGTLSLTTFKNVMEFLSSHNNPKYKSLFEQLSTKVLNIEGLLDYAIEKGQKNVAKRLLQNQKVTIDNKEMISRFASLNDKQCSDLILQALAELEKEVPNMPSVKGYVKSGTSGEMDKYTDHGAYNIAAKDYNNQCKSVLSIAITNKNLYLANKIVAKMKQTLLFEEVGDWVRVVEKTKYTSLYNAFKVSISNEDIDSAKQTLNSAIKDGSFK